MKKYIPIGDKYFSDIYGIVITDESSRTIQKIVDEIYDEYGCSVLALKKELKKRKIKFIQTTGFVGL